MDIKGFVERKFYNRKNELPISTENFDEISKNIDVIDSETSSEPQSFTEYPKKKSKGKLSKKRKLFDWFAIYGKDDDKEENEVVGWQNYDHEKVVVLPGKGDQNESTTESTSAVEPLDTDEFLESDKEEMQDEALIKAFLNKVNENETDSFDLNDQIPQLLGAINETFDGNNSTNLTSFEYEFSLNGTEMELRESFGSIQTPKGRKYRPRTFERASLDEALLESELMSYKVDGNETEALRLRELLADPLKLETNDYADSYRDYGSSFIIPVLSSISYDNCTVPLIFADIPVNVRVQFQIIHLANFDSEQMEYTIDLELEMKWYDLRLRNNYTKPVLLREKAVIDKIWRPDPYFVNSKYSYFHRVSFPNFRMRITPEGLVTYTMRVSLLPSCQMVFCKYPHDRQRCDLLLSSIAYPHSFVNFSWNSVPFTFKSAIALPELHINTISADTCEVENKLLHSSCLRLLFLLERDGGRFIVEKYVPSTLAMMFAWVAPYVPYNYEDVRIVTPIMVLLALVQMEKDDSAIRTSYLTSMNVWFGMMKAFSVLSLVESLVILAFIKRSRAMEKNASRAVTELEKECFLMEKRRSLRHAHVLDQICRVLSPVTFIVFFNYYVLFVAQGDDNDCVRRQPYKGFLPE
ncbi:unnamed protein product, partial [Mesorhabditis belari]|uniref:Neurotransmitter-gated ion-channel ligand-binding domain-containing protein n=1 Tax=Mesorhabditis belari TaxID=2138241 RepID=A0AAF3FMS8_9BILA